MRIYLLVRLAFLIVQLYQGNAQQGVFGVSIRVSASLVGQEKCSNRDCPHFGLAHN